MIAALVFSFHCYAGQVFPRDMHHGWTCNPFIAGAEFCTVRGPNGFEATVRKHTKTVYATYSPRTKTVLRCR